MSKDQSFSDLTLADQFDQTLLLETEVQRRIGVKDLFKRLKVSSSSNETEEALAEHKTHSDGFGCVTNHHRKRALTSEETIRGCFLRVVHVKD